jgi:hypothetical protein
MDIELYRQRKEDQVCTRCGAPPDSEDVSLCTLHLKEHRQRQKLWVDKKRAARAKAGKCIDCGEKAEPGATKLAPRCKACRIKGNRHQKAAASVVDSHVDSRSRRIADATRVDTTAGNTGRVRYHGKQKRGKPSNGDLDEADLKELVKAVGSTIAALAIARSVEVAKGPRIQRESTLKAAWAVLDMGLRFAAEAMQRSRYESTVLRRLDHDVE